MSKSEAARRLGVSDPTVAKMVALNKLGAENGKPLRACVEEFVRRRARHEYSRTSNSLIFACPVTNHELTGNFYLDYREDGHYPVGGELVHLRQPQGSRRLTGFWEIGRQRADELVSENGVLLSVTGGYVTEAARVQRLDMEVMWRQRKVFEVEPIEGEELESYLGFVAGMQQTPIEVR